MLNESSVWSQAENGYTMWYLTNEFGDDIGPFGSQEAALAEALNSNNKDLDDGRPGFY